jgi:hypothetical protein
MAGVVIVGDAVRRSASVVPPRARGRARGDARSLEAVNRGDVGMIQRCEQLRFALEASPALGFRDCKSEICNLQSEISHFLG